MSLSNINPSDRPGFVEQDRTTPLPGPEVRNKIVHASPALLKETADLAKINEKNRKKFSTTLKNSHALSIENLASTIFKTRFVT